MDSGTRSVWARHAPARAAWLVLPLCLVLAAASSSAAPVLINLNYSTVSGTGTAVGSVSIDDSLLVPNVVGFVNCDLSKIYSFSMTVYGLPTNPSRTSFTKADLIAWYLSTDGSGKLTDLNFFMFDFSSCGPDKLNTDNYALDGIETFVVGLYQHVVGDGNAAVASFAAAPTIQGPSIPTLSRIGLAALAILILAGGALLVVKRLG